MREILLTHGPAIAGILAALELLFGVIFFLMGTFQKKQIEKNEKDKDS